MGGKNYELIGKILATFFYGFLILIIYFYTVIITSFDGNWNNVMNDTFFVLLFFMLLMLIWSKKYKKVIIFIMILLFILIKINAFYYEKYSMKVEPLYRLHNKYNIPLSDMKIVRVTQKFDGDLIGSDSGFRSATIEYNGFNIYVYYENGWKDNYSKVKKETNRINSIFGLYTNDFKLINNPYQSDEYIIYLYSLDETVVDEIIQQLKRLDIDYHLYITKDKKFYNVLRKIDINKLGTPIYNGDDILNKIEGYNEAHYIVGSSDYKKEIFINNMDKTDSKIQKPENYQYIVFYYKPNSFVVYGINIHR